jgi:hypothetical protein
MVAPATCPSKSAYYSISRETLAAIGAETSTFRRRRHLRRRGSSAARTMGTIDPRRSGPQFRKARAFDCDLPPAGALGLFHVTLAPAGQGDMVRVLYTYHQHWVLGMRLFHAKHRHATQRSARSPGVGLPFSVMRAALPCHHRDHAWPGVLVDVQRFPGIGLLVFGDAIRVSRVAGLEASTPGPPRRY